MARAGALAVVGTAGIIRWRREEVNVAKLNAEALVRDGSVDIEFCTKVEKEVWWKDLTTELQHEWQRNGFPEADPNDPTSWTRISNEGQRKYSIGKDDIYSQPDIYKNCLRVQTTVVAMIDPLLRGRVHFGNQTHWKFKMLTFKPIVWLDHFLSRNADFDSVGHGDTDIVLRTDLQGWRLPRFPSPSIEPKATFENGSKWHTDQHTSKLSKTGAAPIPGKPSETAARALGSLIAVVWYCATPGDMGAEEGSTGTLDGSHALVMEMYRRAGQHNTPFSVQHMDQALCRYAPKHLPVEARKVLPGEKVRLIMPTLAHTVVLPQRPMEKGRVRVVQNPKCWIDGNELTLEDMCDDAPLKQFCHDPIGKVSANSLVAKALRGEADVLWEYLIDACKQSG